MDDRRALRNGESTGRNLQVGLGRILVMVSDPLPFEVHVCSRSRHSFEVSQVLHGYQIDNRLKNKVINSDADAFVADPVSF